MSIALMGSLLWAAPSHAKGDGEKNFRAGNKLLREGKLDQALTELNKAIAANPKLAKAYRDRGLVYEKQSKLELAVKDFTKSISFNPQDSLTYNNRGGAYLKQGDLKKARADLQKSIALINQVLSRPCLK